MAEGFESNRRLTSLNVQGAAALVASPSSERTMAASALADPAGCSIGASGVKALARSLKAMSLLLSLDLASSSSVYRFADGLTAQITQD